MISVEQTDGLALEVLGTGDIPVLAALAQVGTLEQLRDSSGGIPCTTHVLGRGRGS